MASGLVCQSCGVEAPTRYVELYQNIGALVMRFHKHVKGNLCKKCINKHFWNFTLVNVTLGWWGMISLICTPIFIVNNTVRYLMSLGLEPPPPTAARPQLTQDAAARIAPHAQAIFQRLQQKEDFDVVARDVASRCSVTPGQVLLYAIAVSQQNNPQHIFRSATPPPPRSSVSAPALPESLPAISLEPEPPPPPPREEPRIGL